MQAKDIDFSTEYWSFSDEEGRLVSELNTLGVSLSKDAQRTTSMISAFEHMKSTYANSEAALRLIQLRALTPLSMADIKAMDETTRFDLYSKAMDALMEAIDDVYDESDEVDEEVEEESYDESDTETEDLIEQYPGTGQSPSNALTPEVPEADMPESQSPTEVYIGRWYELNPLDFRWFTDHDLARLFFALTEDDLWVAWINSHEPNLLYSTFISYSDQEFDMGPLLGEALRDQGAEDLMLRREADLYSLLDYLLADEVLDPESYLEPTAGNVLVVSLAE